jgi:hypothetical protein
MGKIFANNGRGRFLKLAVGLVAAAPLLRACQRAGINPTDFAPTEALTRQPTPTNLPTETKVPTKAPTDTPTKAVPEKTPAPKYTAERLGVRASKMEDILERCCDPGTDFSGCEKDLEAAVGVIERDVLPGLPNERFVRTEMGQFQMGVDRGGIRPGAPIRPVMTLRTTKDNVIVGFPVMGGDGKKTVLSAVLLPDIPWGDSDNMVNSKKGVLNFIGTNDNLPSAPRAGLTLGVVAAKSVGVDTVFAKGLEKSQAATLDSLRKALMTWVIDLSHPLDVGSVRSSLVVVAGIQKK